MQGKSIGKTGEMAYGEEVEEEGRARRILPPSFPGTIQKRLLLLTNHGFVQTEARKSNTA